MANAFTLPEELFDSMINGFDKEPEDELIITVDQNEKNKVDKSEGETRLSGAQKRRIFNISSSIFADTNLKKFFQDDYEKHLKNIEKIESEETKQVLEVIKEEKKEEVKKEKEKKKFSFKRILRRFRMVSHILKFITDLYYNFKNFGNSVGFIFEEHFSGKGYSVGGILTDEKERKDFVNDVFEAMEEIAYAFYYNILLDSIQPALEFFTKIIMEKVLEFIDRLQETLEGAEEVMKKLIEDGLLSNEAAEFSNQLKQYKGIGKRAKTAMSTAEKASKGKKMTKAARMGKKALNAIRTAGKIVKTAKTIKNAVTVTRAVSLGIKAAAGGTAATGIGAPVGAVLLAVGLAIDGALYAWSAYNMQQAYEAVNTALHNLGEMGTAIGNEVEEMVKKFEGLATIESLISMFNLSDATDLQKALLGDTAYRQRKIDTFLDTYAEYSGNIDKIIQDFNDSKNFDFDEKIALKLKKLNPAEYYPYTYLISKWAGFFKKFIDKFSILIENITPFLLEFKAIEQKQITDKNPNAKIKHFDIKSQDSADIPLDKHYTGGQLGKIHHMKHIKTLRLKSKTVRLSQCLNTIRVKLSQLNKLAVWPT